MIAHAIIIATIIIIIIMMIIVTIIIIIIMMIIVTSYIIIIIITIIGFITIMVTINNSNKPSYLQVAAAHKDAKKSQMVMPPIFVNTMEKAKERLEQNLILNKQTWTSVEVEKINEFLPGLITTKPVVYLLNLTEKAYVTKKTGSWMPKIFKWVQEHGGGAMIPFSVEYEQRLYEAKKAAKEAGGELDTNVDVNHVSAIANSEFLASFRTELSEEFGADNVKNIGSALPKIVKSGYTELNLIQFFTTGPTEVRAWTVFRGATAPNAAGVIHGDMEKCFIKAEVCACADFFEHTPEGTKSMAGVKAAGKHRMEGKTYVVQDGDILHIMHNAKKGK
jgi:obg-like ATPase 1